MTPGAIAMRGVARALLQSLLAAIVATLLVGGGLLLAGRDPLAVLTTLVTGALADPYRIAEALGRSCPLLLCGLAVAVAFRAQAWNIGVEGQYLLGAIAATAI